MPRNQSRLFQRKIATHSFASRHDDQVQTELWSGHEKEKTNREKSGKLKINNVNNSFERFIVYLQQVSKYICTSGTKRTRKLNIKCIITSILTHNRQLADKFRLVQGLGGDHARQVGRFIAQHERKCKLLIGGGAL